MCPNPVECQPNAQSPRQNQIPANTKPPAVRHPTRKLEPLPNILWAIADAPAPPPGIIQPRPETVKGQNLRIRTKGTY